MQEAKEDKELNFGKLKLCDLNATASVALDL